MEISNHIVVIEHYDGRLFCYLNMSRLIAQERFLEEVGSSFSREHLKSRTSELDFTDTFLIPK